MVAQANPDADVITIHTVAENKTKSGRNAGSTYLIVRDTTERKLFCFDSALFPALTPESKVQIETKWSQDGETEHIIGARRVGGTAPPPVAAPAMDRDVSIRRQVALKCAVELAVQFQMPDTQTVLGAARLFADWLENTDDDSPF